MIGRAEAQARAAAAEAIAHAEAAAEEAGVDVASAVEAIEAAIAAGEDPEAAAAAAVEQAVEDLHALEDAQAEAAEHEAEEAEAAASAEYGEPQHPTRRTDGRLSDAPWLVVGLGNPGPQYAPTRHNIGAMAVEALAGSLGGGLSGHRRCRAEVYEGRLGPLGHGATRVVLARSRGFMNESGGPVACLAEFFKVARRAPRGAPRRA